jgi:hypothetical protein
MDTFLATEKSVFAYNNQNYKLLISGRDDEITSAYTYALSFIQQVLGDMPNSSDLLWSRHGPGASLDTENGLTSQFHKFENWPYSVTNRAFRHGVELIKSDHRWLGALENDYRRQFNIAPTLILNQDTFWRSVFRRVESNRITTVPKSYLTDRTIAIEPTMNLFLQLGVDGYIRKRLKRWDINLDDQKKNQKLARLGSLTGDFATIDLKAASDSISLRLCSLLFPTEWYNLFCDLRAPKGSVDGDLHLYSKISSMGNGYTFALESLIFASVVYGVLKTQGVCTSLQECAIYGDDLVVPTQIVPLLEKVLKAFGFTINTDKSFTKGPIRESCGADWHSGFLVRPVFLTNTPNVITEVFCDYNRLKRILSLYWGIKSEESKCLNFIFDRIPAHLQNVQGPISDEDFDSYIHTEYTTNAVHSRGMWKHACILPITTKLKPKNFLFRKLMAYLRPRGKVQSKKGSVFEVARPKALRLSRTFSSAGIWQSEYAAQPVAKNIFNRH